MVIPSILIIITVLRNILIPIILVMAIGFRSFYRTLPPKAKLPKTPLRLLLGFKV